MKHLYIIGNGFDLHHGIPSSYKQYMTWLICHYPDLYDEIARTFKDADEDSWWADFEHRLAEVEYMYDLSIQIYPDIKVLGVEIKGTNSPERLAATFKAVQKTFTLWVYSLNELLLEYQPDLKLDPDATYLTFNYTNTLQDLYHIPDKHVLHIHGKAERGDELIIGHESDGNDFALKQLEEVGFQKKPYRISRQIAVLRKPTERIIEMNRAFFESLSDVETITVYGFSFSSIDMPYIREIIKHIKSSGVKWQIYVHSKKDEKRIEKCDEMWLHDVELLI